MHGAFKLMTEIAQAICDHSKKSKGLASVSVWRGGKDI